MTERVNSKLQHLWNLFVKASAGSSTRSSWLDLFLAEFLYQIKNGANAKEILSFWTAGEPGVATLIGCELLSTVHQICNIPDQTEELKPLRNFLLREKGWRFIAVLNILFIEGICCNRELVSLLISLYPVCMNSNNDFNGIKNGSTTTLVNGHGSENDNKMEDNDTGNEFLSLKELNIDQAIAMCGTLLRYKSQTLPVARNKRHHSRQHSVSPMNYNNSQQANEYSNSNTSSSGKGRNILKKLTKESNMDSAASFFSTDSEHDEQTSLETLNRKSLALKIQLNPMDFDYYTSTVRDDHVEIDNDFIEESLLTPEEKRVRQLCKQDKESSYRDLLTEELKQIINSTVNQYEFSILVIQLLQKLCSADIPTNLNDHNQSIAINCINFALENLCSLQFGSAPTDHIPLKKIVNLKIAMTQLILSSFEKIVKQSDVSTIVNNGILPMLLRILDDITNKFSNGKYEFIKENSNICNAKQQEYIFGIIYGVISFLYHQLMRKTSIDKTKDFLDLFYLFSNSQNGRLMDHIISILIKIPNTDSSVTFNRIKKLIDFFGQLIISLKKVRSDLLHLNQCQKSRHKQCRATIALGKHHHNDMFGAFYKSGSNTNLCSISILFMILIQLVQNKELKTYTVDLQIRLVKVMILCGTCCCFPARRLMSTMVKLLLSTCGKIRPLAFTLIERTLYSELGAMTMANLDKNTKCELCARQLIVDGQSMKYFLSGEYSAEESFSESLHWTQSTLHNDNMLLLSYYSDSNSTSTQNESNAWNFLEQYNTLINSSDIKLSYMTISHLLRVAPRSSPRIRYELLFNVFYPVFLSAKNQYLSKTELDVTKLEHEKFKILTSLSLFASLLNSVPFAEQFVNLEGLVHITNLVNIPEFSKACCSVLENTVIIEVWKLENQLNIENIKSLATDPIHVANSAEIKQLPSLITLTVALEQSTQKILHIFKNITEVSVTNSYVTADDSDTDKTVENASVDSNQQQQQWLNNSPFIELLHNASVFWRTFASLCLYSPQLRQFMSTHSINTLGDELLWIVLERITTSDFVSDAECLPRERRLLLKLLEAILTVKLTAPTVEMPLERVSNELGQHILKNSMLLKSKDVVELCDVLLRCAILRPSPEQVMPPHSKPKLPLIEAVTSSQWDDESTIHNLNSSRRLALSDSSIADAYITADEGYEADVEIPEYADDNLYSKYEVSLGDSSSSGDSTPQLPACESTTTSEFIFAEYCRTRSIVHPTLCLLALDLLISLNENKKSHGEHVLEDVSLCLQRMLLLCRDNPHNCISLAYAGATRRLLTGFESCLITQKLNLVEIQHSVLEMITLLSKHSITRTELALYLQMFKTDNPPLSLLLEPLVILAMSSRPQPNHILCFPSVEYPNDKKPVLNENAALHLANNLRTQHVGSEQSAWINYAVCLPINSDMGWSMWTHGYSYCFWMRHERPGAAYAPGKRSGHNNIEHSENFNSNKSGTQTENNQLHLISIGNDALVVEMWADSANEQIIFRLSRPELKTNRVLSEQIVSNCLLHGQWHHLALNVRDNIQKRKIVIEVTLIINGWKEVFIKLPVSGLLPKIKRTCVLLGQVYTQNNVNLRSSWFFGNLMLFRTPVFSKERAIYLVALGPNYTSLTECEVGKQIPNFTSIFGPRNISSVIDWDSILDAANGNLKELQDNLLLSYNAQNPNVVNVYPQIVTNPSGTVGHLFSNQPSFRVVTTDQRACQQLPLALAPGTTAPLVPQHFQGLAAAATLLGGISTFIFLFARVVELKGSGAEQGMALRLLLRLVQVDSELHVQFQQKDGYQLLLRVLSSNQCEQSQHILKAILDICCDKPILHFQCNSNLFTIINQTDAIIVNPNLVKLAINGWNSWTQEALQALLNVLHALLHDEHPFREFNAAQLNRVHLVESLLNVCKERYLYEESKNSEQLNPTICSSVVELVRSLMGAPPEFCHIVAVFDFLLLLHQASATYVTHVRSSFYYLLTDALPQGQNASNPLSLPSCERLDSLTDDSSSLTRPVDPRKLNKALTNLKIQQRSADTSKRSRRKKKTSNQHQPTNSNENLDTNRIAEIVVDSGIAGSYKELTSSDPDNLTDDIKSIKHDDDASDFEIVYTENQSDTNIEVIEHSISTQTSEFPTVGTITGVKLFDPIKSSSEAKCGRYKSKHTDPIKENVKVENLEENENHRSLWSIIEGLLNLLRDTLSVLPDTMSSQVLCHVVKPEVLLVMANHRSSTVRTAVVKVLIAYLHRSPEEELNKFVKNKYFYHLANQLNLFPATRELASACGTLITRCLANLEEQIELASWNDLSTIQLAALPPILALLPKSLNDISLTKEILTFIGSMIGRSLNTTYKALLDKGLIEVLLRTLKEMLQYREVSVLSDLVALLVSISSRCLSMAGTQNLQVVLDMHLQLYYLKLCENSTKISQNSEYTLRAQQCAIFDGQLDALQERLNTYNKSGFRLRTTASYLASVLSTSYEMSSTGETSPLNHTPGRAHRINNTNSNSVGSLPTNVSQISNSIGLLLGTTQPREIHKNELCDRLKTILVKCVEFLVNIDLVNEMYPQASITETKLVRRVFLTLLQGLSSSNGNSATNDLIPLKLAIWNARGALRKPAAEMLVWLMAPGQPTKLRMFALHSLREERNCKEIINTLLQTHPQIEQKFTVYLWDLMYNTNGFQVESESSDNSPLTINSNTNIRGISCAELQICEDLKEDLQCWGILSPHSIGHQHDQWNDEIKILHTETVQDRRIWFKQTNRGIYRSLYKLESITKSLTEGAMAITRSVVEAQNRERKSFMEYMKQSYTERLQARIRWQYLIQQLTHERAVWYFPKSYPQSWQLDPTEGPLRVRKRLQRCHLNINPRFLLKEQQHKLEAIKHNQPLSYLLKLDQQSSTSSLLIERLHTSEKVRHMCTAQVITPAFELPGELLIGECCLHFVPGDNVQMEAQSMYELTSSGLDLSCMAWQFENIREIHNRRFQLQERAIEIFLTNGKTYLVAFPTSKDRDDFVQQLSQCHLPNRVQSDYLNDSVQLWRQNLLTNWEYVTQLNKMSGRSYNDLMQYPVFPFVLADYISETIDLSNHKIYRNFKKPMAVQDKKNEQHYINNYNYLKQALVEGMNSVTLNKEPYHYGSHYSNSGTVLHFLVRLPPFTKMFLSYQDNNFDIPDRTFHALATTWRLTSCDSTTDVKELIPEFFFLPEFLQNYEGFNLGTRQNGEVVHNVRLPPWSKDDARLFTLVHRQALESDYVRENLPHWIDLVFGYKQTGRAAVEAINVFHPATYYGFNVENISDLIERNAWETMVRTYGQTPRQLFRTPHTMVVQPLTNTYPNSVPPVLEEVQGLRWGSFVGSPELPAPISVWKRNHRSPIATLVPISSNDVYGLPPHTALLLGYSREKDVTVVGTTPISGSALITWGHSDNIVRVKLKKEHPPWPLVQSPVLDPMVLCTSVPDLPQLWLGHNSGSIHVYSYTLWPDRGQLDLKPEPAILLGHTGPITSLALCPAFSIAVSGSQDGTAIIWDLNTLSYVRSITMNKEFGSPTPVNIVTISDTLGDIAISRNPPPNLSGGSILSVYTINCVPVATVTIPERITAMRYSAAPEGVSVNVLATGFKNGVVRLWNSWNLKPVRDISCSTLTHPIISIAYSHDSQHLFVSASNGTVIIWETPSGPNRTPKFLNLTSL